MKFYRIEDTVDRVGPYQHGDVDIKFDSDVLHPTPWMDNSMWVRDWDDWDKYKNHRLGFRSLTQLDEWFSAEMLLGIWEKSRARIHETTVLYVVATYKVDRRNVLFGERQVSAPVQKCTLLEEISLEQYILTRYGIGELDRTARVR